MTVKASGIILYRVTPEGARVLLLRNRSSGQWGFSKGRRDPDDAHEVATALREVAEETGYTGITLHPSFRSEIDYLVRARDREPYTKRVVYFLGPAPESEPRLSNEHDACTWADGRETGEKLAFGQLRDLARAAFEAIAAP